MSTVQTTNIKNAASASNNITLDASGNVGIGATVPNGKLQVAAGASGQFIVGFNGTSVNFTDVDTNIFRPAAGTTESMRITASGNVGIGTSSPGNRLEVAFSGDNGMMLRSSSAGAYLLFANTSGAVVSNVSNTPMVFTTNNTERMRIDASGNVGIGTASPQVRLEVAGGNGTTRIGQLQFTNHSGSYIAGTDGIFMFPFSDGIFYADNYDGGFAWRTGASVERMRLDSSGNLQFNSGYGSVATAFGCRAWVNFNGTGTVAIRASGNVSSITDVGVGDYTVNFTTAMPDSNYCLCGNSGGQAGSGWLYGLVGTHQGGTSTTNARIRTANENGVTVDEANMFVAIFR